MTFVSLRPTPRIMLNLLLLSSLVVSSTACSNLALRERGANGETRTADGTIPKPAQPVLKNAPETEKTADLSDTGSDLEAIPLAVNKQVLNWIDYFQGRGRPHMERYLSRSARYMPLMKSILKKEGLPEDLIYIALIESGFSSTAHSSANAVGYWQFIRGTGKRYGLRIDTYVDDRRDFVKATQAAAEYFKGLYNIFGVWYLAIASYNVGENRIIRLVEKNKTRDFWLMARENRLPEETQNYVPKFLAARLIAKDPEKYGFTDIEYMPALDFAEVEIGKTVDLKKLAQGMNLEYDDIRDLNPAWKRGLALAKDGKLTLRVPKGTEQAALDAINGSVATNTKIYVADEDYTYYRIRRGDTISTLARKFSTTQHQLRALNRMSTSTQLVAGRRIRVPAETVLGGLVDDRSSKGAKRASTEAVSPTLGVEAARPAVAEREPSEAVTSEQNGPMGGARVHVVRKGDTLIEIAKRYQVSLSKLASLNGITRRSKVAIGMRLEIP